MKKHRTGRTSLCQFFPHPVPILGIKTFYAYFIGILVIYVLKIALVLIPNVFLMSVCNITFANHTSQGCISLLLRLITADNPPHPTSKSEWAFFCTKGFGGKKGREDGFGPQVRNLNFFGLTGQLQLQWVFSVFKHLVRLPSHIKNFDTHLCNSAPSVFKSSFS